MIWIMRVILFIWLFLIFMTIMTLIVDEKEGNKNA